MDGVVMLVNEFPPLPVGGAERQAERLSAYLTKRGWPVWVITRSTPDLPASESRFGFRIVRPATLGWGKLKTGSFVIGALVELWRLRKKFCILHAHLAFSPAFAAVLGAFFLRKHVVVKLGNSGEYGDIHVSQRTWRGRLRLLALRRWADVIIVLDEVMRAEALSAGFNPKRIRLMMNGIDAQDFTVLVSPTDAQLALGLSEKIVVLSMGRLTVQKSLPVLLQSFASAFLVCPELHLLILGDGPERNALEEMVLSLKISDHVTFTGNVADVRPYLNAAHIFVLPSISEGISNSLLEAMSAGLPCLATPVGGNLEVLDHGRCGMLLPVGDVTAWSEALIKLGQSEKMREQLGKTAQERIRNEFDFRVIGSRYESLYGELLENKPLAVKTLWM